MWSCPDKENGLNINFKKMENINTNSTKYWHERMFLEKPSSKNEIENKIIKQLKNEMPSLLSVIFERKCNLSCKHCLYSERECSSRPISKNENFDKAVLQTVSQIPKKNKHGETPQFLHSGRIIAPSHIELMAKIRKSRTDIKVGLIDNGSYTNYLDKFKKESLKLDWLDVSLDGIKTSHNKQRPSKNNNAFAVAIKGLEEARKIVKSSGYVASLFTMTNINFKDIKACADILFSTNKKNKKYELADLMAITTMAPIKKEHSALEVSTREFEVAWKQIKKANKEYNNKVVFHIYRHQELEKLAKAVGEKKFLQSVKNSQINLHNIMFELNEVKIYYSPLSTWPKEEMVLDSDARIRLALSSCYTLEELNKGKSKTGKDISKFTVTKVSTKMAYKKTYHQTVEQWWEVLGKKFLEEEREVFDRIRKRSK